MDTGKLDDLMIQHRKIAEENIQHAKNIEFLIHKMDHGTADEKKLIGLMSKLTLDSLQETVKQFQKNIDDAIHRMS